MPHPPCGFEKGEKEAKVNENARTFGTAPKKADEMKKKQAS